MELLQAWPAWFKDLAGPLPRDYCSVDIETTGFARDRDVITEIGHVLVEDGRIKKDGRLSIILNWTNHPIVPDHWLRKSLDEVAERMARQGKQYHIDYHRMKHEGRNPEETLAWYLNFFERTAEAGYHFAGHNLIAFDEDFLLHAFAGFSITPTFSFPDNQVFDTDAIERGLQLPFKTNKLYLPIAGDTLRDYFLRLLEVKQRGLHSNLNEHCVKKYGLVEKHGLDKGNFHTAEHDALLVHHLIEHWRELYLAAEAARFAKGTNTPKDRQEFFAIKNLPKPTPPAGARPQAPPPPPSRPKQPPAPAAGLLPSDRKRGQRNR